MRFSQRSFKMDPGRLFILFCATAVLICASWNVLAQTSAGKRSDPIADSLVQKASDFALAHPSERVFVVFDSESYTIGTQARFTALLLDGTTPFLSENSGILYMEWIHPSGEIIKRQRLAADNGKIFGSITFNGPFVPGRYTVRAYTNVMRNSDASAFFYKQIDIGMPGAKSSETVNRGNDQQQKTDQIATVHFYPEGGTLISGIKSLVAFRAVDEQGRGIDFEGTLVDDKGKTLTTVRSSHQGMGAFPLLAASGVAYSLKLSSGAVYTLPSSVNNGVSLSTANTNARYVQAKIATTVLNDQKVSVIGRMRGVVFFTGSARLNKAEQIVSIQKDELPEGILQLSLVDANGKAICERSVFVRRHNENKPLVTTRRSTQSPDSLELTISLPGGVADSTRALILLIATGSPDTLIAHRIDSEFYLRSRLREYVHQAYWYFENNTRASRYALDLVMLTHTSNEPSWHEIRENNSWVYAVESGINLTGEIRVGEKPAKNATFAVTVPQIGDRAFSVFETDSAGRFRVDNLNFADTIATYWKLMSGSKRGDVSVRIDSLTPPPAVDKSYLAVYDPQILNDFRVRYPSGFADTQALTDSARVLDEVVVKASSMTTRHIRGNYLIRPDERDIKARVSTATFVARYSLKLRFVETRIDREGDVVWVVRSKGEYVPFGPVFIDGVEHKTKGPDGRNPNHILESIRIEDIAYVAAPRNGGIAIWTKRPAFTESAVRVTLRGYDNGELINLLSRPVFDPASRSFQTLHWEGDLEFDATGSSMSTFFCPPKVGTIQIDINGVLQGTTMDFRERREL